MGETRNTNMKTVDYSQKANLINHPKKCQGETKEPRKYKATVKESPECGRIVSATNMARHIRSCENSGESQPG